MDKKEEKLKRQREAGGVSQSSVGSDKTRARGVKAVSIDHLDVCRKVVDFFAMAPSPESIHNCSLKLQDGECCVVSACKIDGKYDVVFKSHSNSCSEPQIDILRAKPPCLKL